MCVYEFVCVCVCVCVCVRLCLCVVMISRNNPVACISAVKYDNFGFIGFYIVIPSMRGKVSIESIYQSQLPLQLYCDTPRKSNRGRNPITYSLFTGLWDANVEKSTGVSQWIKYRT